MVEDESESTCVDCGTNDGRMSQCDGEWRCFECAYAWEQGVAREAAAYALAKCKITRTFGRDYSDSNWRNNCTNYEELIRGLDRDDRGDGIRYWAIRDRIDALVEELEEIDEDDDPVMRQFHIVE